MIDCINRVSRAGAKRRANGIRQLNPGVRGMLFVSEDAVESFCPIQNANQQASVLVEATRRLRDSSTRQHYRAGGDPVGAGTRRGRKIGLRR